MGQHRAYHRTWQDETAAVVVVVAALSCTGAWHALAGDAFLVLVLAFAEEQLDADIEDIPVSFDASVQASHASVDKVQYFEVQ